VSASMTSMHDFIEALRVRVPRDIHPAARRFIHEDFGEMREAVDDPARVMHLIAKVRDRIASELRWEAKKFASVRDFKDAYRLRRQADKFEAAHV
jgi:hypothetical protein